MLHDFLPSQTFSFAQFTLKGLLWTLILFQAFFFFLCHSLHYYYYFCRFLFVRQSATPWMSLRWDRPTGCAIIAICTIDCAGTAKAHKSHRVPGESSGKQIHAARWRLFILPFRLASQNRHQHFWLWMSLYELVCLEAHTEFFNLMAVCEKVATYITMCSGLIYWICTLHLCIIPFLITFLLVHIVVWWLCVNHYSSRCSQVAV